MIKIMIIESVPALRKHARHVLSRRFSGNPQLQFYEAADHKSAMVFLKSYNPEYVIIGGGINSTVVARQIWESHPSMRILLWSRIHEPYKLRHLVKTKPPGSILAYVMQTSSDQILLTAMESIVYQRDNYVDPAVRQTNSISDTRTISMVEYETLGDLVLGLTDKAISLKRFISVRGVQHRIGCVAAKLGVKVASPEDTVHNLRVCIAVEAVRQGVLTVDDIAALEAEHRQWLHSCRQRITKQPGELERYPVPVLKPVPAPVDEKYFSNRLSMGGSSEYDGAM